MIMGEREWSLQDVTEEIKARTKLGLSFYSVWETLYDSSLSKSES